MTQSSFGPEAMPKRLPDIEAVMACVKIASDATLRFFGRPMTVDRKADDSPLTQADRESHAIIASALRDLDGSIPVISEEGQIPDFHERKRFSRFWLVDPLDGTKEFVKTIPEYTVNVALIEHGRPVLGVVGVPKAGCMYGGSAETPTFRQNEDGKRVALACESGFPQTALRLAVSRSHPSPELEELQAALPGSEMIPLGSALKFCRVAEGMVDFYPRFSPLMEWDTAAAHAVLEYAGGVVTDMQGKPIQYNKSSLKHQTLLVSRSRVLTEYVLDVVNRMRT